MVSAGRSLIEIGSERRHEPARQPIGQTVNQISHPAHECGAFRDVVRGHGLHMFEAGQLRMGPRPARRRTAASMSSTSVRAGNPCRVLHRKSYQTSRTLSEAVDHQVSHCGSRSSSRRTCRAVA